MKNKSQLKNKKVLISGFLLFTIYYLLFTISASAQTDFTGNLSDFPGSLLNITMLLNIVGRLACYFIRFGIISVGVAIVIYGYMFFSSRGNPQGFGSAKKSLIWGLVGGLVIFGVFTIILTVSDLVGYGATESYIGYPILTIVKCS